MASHLPKVEVFQLTISKVGQNSQINFGELYNRLLPQSEENNPMFERFFRYFINRIDTEAYYQDTHSKKAFTVYQNEDNQTNQTISYNSAGSLLQGKIKGGSFGRRKFKSNIELKNEIDEISPNNVVCDDFYFLLYTPLDFHCGVLIIQSYSDNNIRETFLKFLKQLLNIRTHKVKQKQFLPERYKTLFQDNYLLKDITFNTTFSSSDIIGDDELTEDNHSYSVKITITPESENISGIDRISQIASDLIQSSFSRKRLGDFDKRRVHLGSNSSVKGAYYDLGSDMKIRPVIYLEDIDVDDNETPDFEQIKRKCNEILEEVKREIYPN